VSEEEMEERMEIRTRRIQKYIYSSFFWNTAIGNKTQVSSSEYSTTGNPLPLFSEFVLILILPKDVL
jgi:hypothetical protein